MKYGILGLSGIGLMAAAMVSAQPNKAQPAKYGWLQDWSAAQALARKTGQPLMVVFRCEP